MRPIGILIGVVLVFAAGSGGAAFGDQVKVLLPDKPWELSIALKDFQPKDVLGPNVVLGGRTKDKVNVTVTTAQVEQGTSAAQVRDRRGKVAATRTADPATVETREFGNTAALWFRWRGNKDMSSFHGYIVRQDLAFDVHVSAYMTDHTQDELLALLASVKVKPSAEWQDMAGLLTTLEEQTAEGEQESALKAFLEKYPGNSWGHLLLGQYYREEAGDLDAAGKAYEQALANHQTLPITNPASLWTCYDALAAYYAQAGKPGQATRYVQKAYELAKELEDDALIAASAYALARAYAQDNHPPKCMEFLNEAIHHDATHKATARNDTAFDNLRNRLEFKKLIGGN